MLAAPVDVPTSEWEPEWAALAGLGGCAAISMAGSMGITCETELSTSAAAALAPEIRGKLCDKCAASCEGLGQPCAVETGARFYILGCSPILV